MGTRNLTIAILDGEVRVAQYGQWDGYPVGQGKTIVDFLNSTYDPDKMKPALRNCRFLSDEEIENLYNDCGIDISGDTISIGDARKFQYHYPQLDRDMGADILEYIQNNNGAELSNMYEFAAHSLFCEWAYVVDFDNEVLEVYQGFNETPLKEEDRFYHLNNKIDDFHGDYEYFPVKIVTEIPFDKLTENTMKDIEESLEEEE